jgi:hypothetical protein
VKETNPEGPPETDKLLSDYDMEDRREMQQWEQTHRIPFDELMKGWMASPGTEDEIVQEMWRYEVQYELQRHTKAWCVATARERGGVIDRERTKCQMKAQERRVKQFANQWPVRPDNHPMHMKADEKREMTFRIREWTAQQGRKRKADSQKEEEERSASKVKATEETMTQGRPKAPTSSPDTLVQRVLMLDAEGHGRFTTAEICLLARATNQEMQTLREALLQALTEDERGHQIARFFTLVQCRDQEDPNPEPG